LQARRILLVLAIMLLVTAAAASVVPVPEETTPERTDESPSERPQDRPPEAVEPPPGFPPADGATEVAFSAGAGQPTETVESGAHVIVTVEAPQPGEVELADLGRIAPVAPRTPATFDLFTDRPGRFPVLYTPVRDGERRLGTLVVESSSAARP
jgi:hypothetical protein